jgi:N-acetylmuramoyl-L-alanine amidase
LKITSSQRSLRWAALLLLAALPAMPAYARAHRGESHHGEAWARDHFAAAERMREALNGRPQMDRTRHDYQRVINAYRGVYYGAPSSTKADPSVVAVAETMVEMGRRFEDDKILNDAIGQYKFLRREYPGSKYRCDALFTIGEIYKDDLNDPDSARATFQEFLHRYPHNRLVDDAQQAVADLDRQAQAEPKSAAKKTAKSSDKPASDKPGGDSGKAASDAGSKYSQGHADADASTSADRSADQRPNQSAPNHFPRVTGIRHWSTPDYTRVAIDLESEVKFGSQRIADPDRIFFDLRDTKLASTLVGKSFDVDDGFLKKIRVAQFQPGRTRVVLEVDNLSDYDAFLLPNPYRLIIDIHGKNDKAASAKLTKEQAAAVADEEAPPKAGLKPEVSKPELKADLKALAGTPPSKPSLTTTKESVESKQDDVGSDSSDSLHTSDSPHPSSPRTSKADARAYKLPPGVKKVVVDNGNENVNDNDNDDSDNAPSAAETAKTQSAIERARRAVGHKAESSKQTDSNASAGSDSAASKEKNDKGDKSAEEVASDEDGSDKPLNSSRKASDFAAREARPTASGDRSLIRALGLKIGKIVIDPGHGGHDTGTIGPNGLEEKDLVLEVGRRLGKLLETRLGAEVVYTRKNDTFIPLETRTAIANQQRADLFISIHANSSHDPDARGVETYYLNFTSSPEALDVAARENAVSEKSIYELQDLVKKIALKEKIEESREFAGDVQESLHSGLAAKSPGIRDRGVKKAPFIVLIGANMPSILAEISFVSNPGDEHRLETSEYRQKIAESLYRGIAKYVNGLSGVKVASKIDRTAGQ